MSTKQDVYFFWMYQWEKMDDEKTWVYSTLNGSVQMGPLAKGKFFALLSYNPFYLNSPPEQYFEYLTFAGAEGKAEELLKELLQDDEDA